MQNTFLDIEHYGLLIIFLNVLLGEGGLPLPAIPVLMAAGAQLMPGGHGPPRVILAGLAGCLIADLAWYWGGKREGQKVLGLLCKLSLSPDFCVRQAETAFLKIGRWSLLFAKFFPGLSTLSVAMAGVTGMPLSAFLVLNTLGAFLFVTVPVAAGFMFQDAINDVLRRLAAIGKLGVLLVGAVLALYLLVRWWRRRAFIRQLRMDRITVDELRREIDQGRSPLILDVRPKAVRDGMIPGAVSGEREDLERLATTCSHTQEIVVYCACPNEASAATAARRLKQAGFTHIRPLLGGIDAWVAAGQPLEGMRAGRAGAQPAAAATAPG